MGAFWTAIEQLLAEIVRSRAVNVNSDHLREQARNVAQKWFREDRPNCVAAGASATQLDQLDKRIQDLLRLANGRNLKRSYVRTLRAIRETRPTLQAHIDMLHGQASQAAKIHGTTSLEAGIVETLEKMLPAAA